MLLEQQLVDIYIMGKRYRVPEGLTIMKAIEYAGYHLVRGVGCRGGFCGACATMWRIKGSAEIKYGLACQSVIEPDMFLMQLPFFPAQKALYNIAEIKPSAEQVLAFYPELLKCLGCNTCTKSCPQDIQVLSYVSDAMRGDTAECANKSFDCVMCGLCAARCPAGIVPYNAGILCRRLYGKYVAPESTHLQKRVDEIKNGAFDTQLVELKKKSTEQLGKMYAERDIET